MPLQRILRILLSLVVLGVFLLHSARLLEVPLLQQLENWTYDTRLRLTLPGGVDERIVIVDIDESSLARVGRWPWRRDRLAELVDTLFDHYGVRLLGFDVVFAEADESSGLPVLEKLARGPLRESSTFKDELNRLRPRLETDRLFARSLEGRPVVLGFYFNRSGEAQSVGRLPEGIDGVDGQWRTRIPFFEPVAYGANLAVLQQAARTAGYFDNPMVDRDGVFRRVPMVQEYDGRLYASLSLAMALAALGDPELEFKVVTDDEARQGYVALEYLKLRDRIIPVDERAGAIVPYRGPRNSYPYVSIADVLTRQADPSMLEGKLVLVGATAPGLLDLRSTPVQNVYPGVEVHANLLAGILDNRIRQQPAWTLGYEFVVVALCGLLLTALLPYLSPLWGLSLSVGLGALVVGVTMAAWSGGLVLPLAVPLLTIAALFVVNMTYGFFVESRDKRMLTGLFGQYVPPELVDEMSTNPGDLALESERRDMTVLFSDVRNFTTLSEGLDPKQLTALMNEFLTPMTQVIHRHRGTIDKYMGDAIMAFWGAPLPDMDHPRNALRAGMDMLAELDRLRPTFAERGWPVIDIGIGLSSGEMSVGNMGSEFRRAYTVMGDTVNLGSRLEGLTKQYGARIIVNDATAAAVPEFAFRELDRVRVKGRDKAVSIFEPLGLRIELDAELKSLLTRYKQALRVYRQSNWDDAEMEFFTLHRARPDDRLYKLYLQRIAHYRQHPPPGDWDGSFTYTTK